MPPYQLVLTPELILAEMEEAIENEHSIHFPAVLHFHPGVCHICKAKPSDTRHLKRCSQCQLVPYCSRICQKKDWARHKPLCQVNAVKSGKNVFGEAKGTIKSRERWMLYRTSLMVSTSLYLGRGLEQYEKEIFGYPRVCEVCWESDSSKLMDCCHCHSVFYCCDEHRRQDSERHKKWCSSYYLCLECDVFEAKKGIQDLSLPGHVDENYTLLPETFVDLLKPQLLMQDIPHGMTHDPKYMVMLTDRLSYPLTLLYALQKVGVGTERTKIEEMKEVTVHIVGAKSMNELLGIIRWEYILHRLPVLKKLHIVFIGPELFSEIETENEMTDDLCVDDSGMTRCDDCQKKDRIIVYEMRHMCYHKFHLSQRFTEPHAIIAYNCGFHEFAGEDSDTWPPSLELMVKKINIPIIFTAYTNSEAQKDLEALSRAGPIRIDLEIQKNAYSSIRPFRDMVREDDCDLFFCNQFLCCVRGSSSAEEGDMIMD